MTFVQSVVQVKVLADSLKEGQLPSFPVAVKALNVYLIPSNCMMSSGVLLGPTSSSTWKRLN